jgi:hypothetical protein
MYRAGTLVEVAADEVDYLAAVWERIPNRGGVLIKNFKKPTVALVFFGEGFLGGHDGGLWHRDSSEWNGYAYGHVYVPVNALTPLEPDAQPVERLPYWLPKNSNTAAIINLLIDRISVAEIAARVGISRQAAYQKLRQFEFSPNAILTALSPGKVRRVCAYCGKALSGKRARFHLACRTKAMSAARFLMTHFGVEYAIARRMLEENSYIELHQGGEHE